MSYSSLIIQLGTNTNIIDSITVGTHNVIRDSWTSTREWTSRSQKPGLKNPLIDVPYTHVRKVHTWVGHFDVNKDSVGSADGGQVLRKLHDPVLYTSTIEHDVKSTPTVDTLGNLAGPVVQRYDDPGFNWVYKYRDGDLNLPYYATEWFIKQTKVQDNLDNATSRVTIVLEAKTTWEKLENIIDN